MERRGLSSSSPFSFVLSLFFCPFPFLLFFPFSFVLSLFFCPFPFPLSFPFSFVLSLFFCPFLFLFLLSFSFSFSFPFFLFSPLFIHSDGIFAIAISHNPCYIIKGKEMIAQATSWCHWGFAIYLIANLLFY